MTTQSLLLLELLANRTLNPGAIALHLPAGDDSDLLALAETGALTDLAKAFPCLLPAPLTITLSPESQAVLSNAGCQIATENAIHEVNTAGLPQWPETASWLAGRWYQTSPEKPPVNQTASRALELKLLQLVANDAETREIEDVFRRDPVLAYHLLRLVNSLGLGMSRNVSNFSQAILILGRQQLKRWLNLMLFAANRSDHRSAMLMARVSVRARSMELLAGACGFPLPTREMAFMIGMFSLLGILFGLPLTKVLAPLNLSDALSAAVLKNEGELGHLKRIVETAENLDHEELGSLIKHTDDLSVSDFNRITIEAHAWMSSIINGKPESADA